MLEGPFGSTEGEGRCLCSCYRRGDIGTVRGRFSVVRCFYGMICLMVLAQVKRSGLEISCCLDDVFHLLKVVSVTLWLTILPLMTTPVGRCCFTGSNFSGALESPQCAMFDDTHISEALRLGDALSLRRALSHTGGRFQYAMRDDTSISEACRHGDARALNGYTLL